MMQTLREFCQEKSLMGSIEQSMPVKQKSISSTEIKVAEMHSKMESMEATINLQQKMLAKLLEHQGISLD